MDLLPWAQEAPGSNPGAPTKTSPSQAAHSPVFFSLLKALFTQNSPVEFRQTGGLNSQNRLIPKSSPHDKYSKTLRGRSAIQKTLNGGRVSTRHLPTVGKCWGPNALYEEKRQEPAP